MKTTDLEYYRCCVNWPTWHVDELSAMIDEALEITRATFLKHVNRDSLVSIESGLGYDRNGMRMGQDYAVTYHRSKLQGALVYYFQHSAIEYVFTEDGKEPLNNKRRAKLWPPK